MQGLAFIFLVYAAYIVIIWLGVSFILWILWNLLLPLFSKRVSRISFIQACGLVFAIRFFDWLFAGRSGQMANIFAGGFALKYALREPEMPSRRRLLLPPSLIVCANCNTENPVSSLHCGSCGQPVKPLPIKSQCKKCNGYISSYYAFCNFCGERMR